jgi:protein gp37
MADGTKIEWSDATWNVITGCSVLSPGCANCFAMRLAGTRLRHHPSRINLTRDTKAGPVWTGEVRFNAEWLEQPLRWQRPRMIFVCAHGDLFHENVPDAWLDKVFAVMWLCDQHIFQVLTKRPERMRRYVKRLPEAVANKANIWLGVSVEDDERARQRIPVLLDTPAALRWVSAEPLIGEIKHSMAGLDWVVVGSESGPGRRECDIDWVRSLRDQCAGHGVSFFWKQHFEDGKKVSLPFLDGVRWAESPLSLNVG